MKRSCDWRKKRADDAAQIPAALQIWLAKQSDNGTLRSTGQQYPKLRTNVRWYYNRNLFFATKIMESFKSRRKKTALAQTLPRSNNFLSKFRTDQLRVLLEARNHGDEATQLLSSSKSVLVLIRNTLTLINVKRANVVRTFARTSSCKRLQTFRWKNKLEKIS